MSNAAMNGGDAIAPAGRACSKFVWQNSRFRRTGRFECCRIRTARPFGKLPSCLNNRRCAPHVGHGPERARSSRPAPAGHVLAAIGRQSSRLKCGGTKGGSQRIMAQRPSRLPAGDPRWGHGPEFVSEFETKQDQSAPRGLMVRKCSAAVAGLDVRSSTLALVRDPSKAS